MMYQDLHSHTILSDGKTTYRQSLDACLENNIGVVAFTDHDLVPEKEELAVLDKLRNHPTKWIVGIEISADPPKELVGKTVPNLHIIGLFIDPANKDLLEYGHQVVDDCNQRMKKMVKAMAGYGFTISFDDCREEAIGKTMQRPHLVAALLKRKENSERMQFFIDDLKNAGKTDPKKLKLYQEVIKVMTAEPDSPYRQPFYQLFLSANAPYHGAYSEREVNLDFDDSVKLICRAGGIAILAHWSESKAGFPLKNVEKIFKEGRIDGAEIVYDLYRINLGEKEELREEQESIKKLVGKYHLLASGGSDAHNEEGFKKFAAEKWMVKQTVGMAEKMLERKENLFLGWSTVRLAKG
ncbi:MAG: hypothetical protein ABH867_03460 [Patescibacteria group bacterium]|nr:hypothetical protein [Patescibacteria group bacterium]